MLYGLLDSHRSCTLYNVLRMVFYLYNIYQTHTSCRCNHCPILILPSIHSSLRHFEIADETQLNSHLYIILYPLRKGTKPLRSKRLYQNIYLAKKYFLWLSFAKYRLSHLPNEEERKSKLKYHTI